MTRILPSTLPSILRAAPMAAILAGGVAVGAIAISLATPAAAQGGDGQLSVRPDAVDEQKAVQTDIRGELDAATTVMRGHVEALREAQGRLDRCTAEAAAPEGGDTVPTIMDCFADQAVTNQVILLDWSDSLEALEGIFADGSLRYGDLARAKAEEIDGLIVELDALEDERAELRRRLERVRAFLETNGSRLEGEAQHEALRLRMEWAQVEHRATHTRTLTDRMRGSRAAFLDAADRLDAAARDADLLALDFGYRAEREGDYVEQISEAALTEVALEQVAGMDPGMGRIVQTIDAVRVTLDAASDERPLPAPASTADVGGSFLGGMEANDGLEDWILNLDMEAGR